MSLLAYPPTFRKRFRLAFQRARYWTNFKGKSSQRIDEAVRLELVVDS
jgi:hypothetical protein